jgi:hypothetical protein
MCQCQNIVVVLHVQLEICDLVPWLHGLVVHLLRNHRDMSFAEVIMIVWQTLSYSRDNLLHQNPGDIIGAILAAILQHMAFLVMNSVIGWLMKMKEVS